MTIDTDSFGPAPERGQVPADDQPRHPVDRARIAQDAKDAAAAAGKVPAKPPRVLRPSTGRPGATTAGPAKPEPGKVEAKRPAGPGHSAQPPGAPAASRPPVRDAAARANPEREHQAASQLVRPRPAPPKPKR